MENYINTFLSYLFFGSYKPTPFTWDYNQPPSIIGLYYWLHTNIGFNLITADQLGFETGTQGPKVTLLPLCYAPFSFTFFLFLPFFIS